MRSADDARLESAWRSCGQLGLKISWLMTYREAWAILTDLQTSWRSRWKMSAIFNLCCKLSAWYVIYASPTRWRCWVGQSKILSYEHSHNCCLGLLFFVTALLFWIWLCMFEDNFLLKEMAGPVASWCDMIGVVKAGRCGNAPSRTIMWAQATRSNKDGDHNAGLLTY